ncbi:uncharacterized protein MONOS_14665 [Monocercomonoides exilis]|uniref:uncharacterized protein n=1 Tax=Monocercomonoides exilis TaxID=2049356 RepID=UPI00355A978C|nr:hypothetical protein MONOS_14665 [Monocercomonoides exilis]|eukprot:MONOS_14665.1-p1 / transcript=MONOS_14665.1 / gene=MONOS_14665 / organism=Monocercomonoides_exilis_PA203 / gene_product=unspecified product / transcript_product=unspecified product / location=Mono_scaffold01045:3901-4594(-) / protein_length=200 / sequence_SO=supercontig / SO=protein_coding / is_pseudo=false
MGEEKKQKEGNNVEDNKTSSSSRTSSLSVIPHCTPPPSTKVNIKQVVIAREKEDAPAQKGKYESSKRKRQSRLGKPKGYGVNCMCYSEVSMKICVTVYACSEQQCGSVECSCFERGVREREEAIQRQDRGGGEEGEGGVFERGEGEEEEGGGREEEGDDDEDESEMLLSKSADVVDDRNRDGIEVPSSCDFANDMKKIN